MWTTWTKVHATLCFRHREKVFRPYCYWNASCLPVYIFIPRPVSSIHTRSLQFSMLTNCWNIISIWTKVMLTLLYIIMTIRNTIVFFLYKTDKGQFNVIIAISHITKPPKSYKNMTYFHSNIVFHFNLSTKKSRHNLFS